MQLTAGKLAADVDAVVFDKDGMLIDLDRAWAGLTEQWLRSVVAEASATSALLVELREAVGVIADGRFVPDGLAAVEPTWLVGQEVERVLSHHGLEAPAAVAEMSDGVYDVSDVDFVPIGDVTGALGRLRSAGLAIAVATSDHREPTMATLSRLRWASLVDAVACGDDPCGAKPDAAVLEELGRQLGVATNRMVMVGDSAGNMLTGRNAGVALNIAIRRPDGSAAHGNDVVVDSIDELLVR